MRFLPQVTKLMPVLGVAVLLAGCSTYDSGTSFLNRTTSSAFEGVANLGSFMPWGGTRPLNPGDSLTVQRIREGSATVAPLLPEEGNVWPAPEAPRATLMNPDQAIRGIPNYPTPAALLEPTQRRGTGGPFVPAPLETSPQPPAPQSALPQLVPLPAAASRPGAPIQTPQGTIVPSTTVGNTSTFNTPGGGSGTITRDGNTTIISRPGEPPQVVQTPR